jgi:cyclomaltodextrinase / maltogenic alpha-amylase / neopullulanase
MNYRRNFSGMGVSPMLTTRIGQRPATPRFASPARAGRPCHRIAALLVLLLFAAIAQADAPRGEVHRFSFQADPHNLPQSVHLAGSFNGWSKDATPMRHEGEGLFIAEVPLPEGVHHYKFVIDGEHWVNDPDSDRELEEPDGFGGVNSAVLIGPDIRRAAPPQPNHVNLDFVSHEADYTPDSRLRLRVRAQAGDVERVLVEVVGLDPHELHAITTERGYDIFGGVVHYSARPEGVRYQRPAYRFLLSDGTETIAYNSITRHQLFLAPDPVIEVPEWARHAVWYQIFPERFRNGDPSNDPAEHWYENLIPWTADWWDAHVEHGEVAGQENFYRGHGNVWRRRYGGDIQGLIESLPYLRELGVNAIYLNPVFKAESMHKYDAGDFRHIDDRFGFKGDIDELEGETDDPATWQWTKTDLLFLDFLAEAKKQGFRVIIDGVWNHTGREHYAFQDVLKHGQNSTYADWFEITDWGTGGEPGQPGGIQWAAWDGPSGHLPVFRKDPEKGLAPGPYEHIMAITERWMAPDGDVSRGIDGWRLDVANEVPHEFWIRWREHVKSINPDAYITGELWGWAQPWLGGDQFDATMNYQFAMTAQEFFVNQQRASIPSRFNSRLVELIYAYPLQVALVNQNLYDSHDTDRLASMFVNPDLPYDGANRIQDNNPDYDPSKPSDEQWLRMKQAVAFQMAFLGAPMIYYGSEAGMWSPDDPSNRQPMIWPDLEPYDDPEVTFRQSMFEHYQRVIAIRHQLPALRTGFFRPLIIDDGRSIYGFVRNLPDQQVYVVLNRSDSEQAIEFDVDEPDSQARLINWLNSEQVNMVPPADDAAPDARPTLRVAPDAEGLNIADGTATITLPPYGTAIISRASSDLNE